MTTEWTAPAVERTEPDKITAERQALEQWLDFHRDTLLTKCTGLTGEQLTRRSVPPSDLSLLGLVRHLADVERGWLRQCAAREDVPDLYWTQDNPRLVGVVTGVIDGDTIKVQLSSGPITVRLANIDAPELGQSGGGAATRALDSRILGKEVSLDVVTAMNVCSRWFSMARKM